VDKNEALVRYEGGQAVAPSIYDRIDDPMSAVERMGAWLAKSNMLGINTPEQGCVVAMTCMQERITPLEFKRCYHVIKGTPSMRADYMQAEFQRAGGRIRWDKTDEQECILTLTHPDYAPEGFTVRVVLAELKKRGITTGMYDKFPRQMLRARAVSEGVRAIMPSINAGTYTPEETEHFDEDAQKIRRPRPIESRVIPAEATPVVATDPPQDATPAEPTTTPSNGDSDGNGKSPDGNGKSPEQKKAALEATLQKWGLVLDDAINLVGGVVIESWGDDEWSTVREACLKVKNAAPEDRKRVTTQAFNLEPGALE
jgi:hypothetical protein